mgnify:CR=1 FL=1
MKKLLTLEKALIQVKKDPEVSGTAVINLVLKTFNDIRHI